MSNTLSLHDHDGGPAYPVPETIAPGDDVREMAAEPGISFVDYMAGQALVALAPRLTAAELPGKCYQIARDMLREKRRLWAEEKERRKQAAAEVEG